MRQIKFRAWDKERDRMIYPDQTDIALFEVTENGMRLIDIEYTEDSSFPSYIDAIIMQSTGLKDKNGVEIFEGDVLGGDTFRGESTAVVEYKSAMWQANGVSLCSFLSPLYSVEVIGNIYDNPELMEVGR